MVYEHEFKQTYYTLNQRPCPFEKAILGRCCLCTKSQRLHIAEREGVTCTSAEMYSLCVTLLERFYENAQFALKLRHQPKFLPHGKAIKIQCGGLLGLHAILHREEIMSHHVEDISNLVVQAITVFGRFEQLPYQEIIKFINSYQGRAKRPRR